jgi:hypothetical protein
VGSSASPAMARPDGPPFLSGTYDANPFMVRVRLPAAGGDGAGTEITIPLILLSPDHFRLGDSVYIRYADSQLGDLPCDPRNGFHVQGSFANLRGAAALRAQSVETANCWFYVGAAQGDREAQRNFAISLYQGRGVKRDYRAALEWFQKAATQGDFQAQFMFSHMFRSGLGGEQNNEKADYWLRVASHNPNAPVALQNAQSEKDMSALLGGVVLDAFNRSSLCDAPTGERDDARRQRETLLRDRNISCDSPNTAKAIRGY